MKYAKRSNLKSYDYDDYIPNMTREVSGLDPNYMIEQIKECHTAKERKYIFSYWCDLCDLQKKFNAQDEVHKIKLLRSYSD